MESQSAQIRPAQQRGWVLLCGILGLIAFRPLLRFEGGRELPEAIESWFFLPSETLPPVVLALSAWLLYRRWHRLRTLPLRAGPVWLVASLLTGGGMIFAWSRYTGAVDLLAISLMLISLGFAALFAGTAGVRAVLVPALVLLFVAPLPPPLLNEIVFTLQIGTAEASGWILSALGLPAFVAGETIQRADFTFSIIEGCSGLRSIETLTTLSILMVDLFRRSGLHAVLLVLAAPIVAFALNAVRTVTLILNPDSEIAAVHNLQGVAILLVGLVVLYGLDGLLARFLDDPSGARAADSTPAPAGAAGLDRRRWIATGTLAALAATSIWLPAWQPPLAPQPAVITRRFEKNFDDWTQTELETDYVFLGRTGFRESFTRRYGGDSGAVELFVGLGDRVRRHRSALSPKTALPGSGWIVEDSGIMEIAPVGGENRSIEWKVVRSGTHRALVYHWYEGTFGLLGESARSLLAVDRTPWGKTGDMVAIRISTELVGPKDAGRAEAEAVLSDYYRSLRGVLDRLDEFLSGKIFS